MSTTIDSKVVQVSLRNQGVFGMPGFGTTKYKYFSELSIIGKKPNRTFSVDLYRKEDGLTQRVAFRNKVGRLDQVLIEGIYQSNEQERALYLSIDKQTKLPTSYWEGLIGDNGLENLAAEEKNRLAIATGNNNEALNSNTAGAVFVGGGTGTDADGTTAVDQTGADQIGGNGGALLSASNEPDVTFDIDGINSSLTNINIKGRSFRDTYKNLHYPEGLVSNRQDRIRFTQKYTQGRKVNVRFDSNLKVFQRDPEIKIDGSVTLPIVTGIGDRNAVDWKDESLNPIQALAAGGAVSVFEGIRKNGVAQTFKDAQGMLQSAGGDFAKSADVGSDMAKAINV